MKKLLASLLLIGVLGCEQNIDTWQPINPTDSRVLAESMEGIPEDTLKNMYKRYVGIAEYVKNSKNTFKDTLGIQEAFERFDSDYDFVPGKYQEFDVAKTEYLKSRGYVSGQEAKDIVDNVVDPNTQISRSKLIEDMQTLADGARMALEAKWKKN